MEHWYRARSNHCSQILFVKRIGFVVSFEALLVESYIQCLPEHLRNLCSILAYFDVNARLPFLSGKLASRKNKRRKKPIVVHRGEVLCLHLQTVRCMLIARELPPAEFANDDVCAKLLEVRLTRRVHSPFDTGSL